MSRSEILLGIVLLIGFTVWHSFQIQKHDDDPAAIVLLLEKPIALDASLLAGRLREISERPVRASNQLPVEMAGDDVVSGASPYFTAVIDGVKYAIHNVQGPYMLDIGSAGPDLRLRKAIGDHKAWVSMDILSREKVSPEEYRIPARLIATLTGSGCLALYHPPLSQYVRCYGEQTVARLGSDDPIEAVFAAEDEDRVYAFRASPRLRAAQAEAKRRFAEFASAFAKKDGSGFSVKAKIASGDNSEHIWVDVDSIEQGVIRGALGNKPFHLPGMKLGSKVEVDVSGVEDWSYLRNQNAERIGGFTVPVLDQIRREARRKP